MLKPLLADNNSVDLIFEDTRDLAPLHTDEGKVSQILRNLISNALKFTPRGQVVISARMMEDNQVLFSVADTGIGIPTEHHETIFREFSQIENPLQERHRGTGLGLPLCRNLAMLLGGRLWLESVEGEGSTFFAQIPAAYVGEAISSDLAAELAAPEFHRTPVLFLEDNLETSHLLESYVRNSEFQPILASSVGQAEAWASRHKPAAVVSDIYIGDDLAWGFLARLREKWPDLPLIVTSIFEESRAALSAGADLFLPKPLQAEVLLNELRRLTAQFGTKRLLLVDDNDVARYILRELLDQPWLQVEEASNGTAAVARLKENIPDAMILDLLMPDISGFEILRQVRADQTTENLPVLIYTSKPLSESERAQLESMRVRIIRKEEVSTRLSAEPFMDWLRAAGLAPETLHREQNV
jgi:DNA-binding response OmpR family regulator